MRRISGCDPVSDSLGLRRPVGSRECETVIRASIQRVELLKKEESGLNEDVHFPSICGF